MPIVCFRIFGSLKKFRKYALPGFPIMGVPLPRSPALWLFWPPPPLQSKLMPPMGYPGPVLQLENNSLSPNFPLKSEAPFLERILRKKTQKFGNCHYYLYFNHKITSEKDRRNSTKMWFLTWRIKNFVWKVKQFVGKYYITWLIDLVNNLYVVEKLLMSFYAICY